MNRTNYLHGVADAREARLRKAVALALVRLRSIVPITRIQLAMASGDKETALRLVPSVEEIQKVLTPVKNIIVDAVLDAARKTPIK